MKTRLLALLHGAVRLLLLGLLILAFSQALPFDLLAMVFAGDVLAYFEAAAALWIVSRVTRWREVWAYARAAARPPLRGLRRRARRLARRIGRLPVPPADDDRAVAFAP
jgi:hypothetical protein